MRIVYISEYNSFTTIGGTEYYIDVLLKTMPSSKNEIYFISSGKHTGKIIKKEISNFGYFYTLYLLPRLHYTSSEIAQKTISQSWQYIDEILQDILPDLIHFHTISTFFNIHHLLLSKQICKNIFFTSHVPGNFCSRGDMIQNGTNPCDGIIGNKCNICLFSKSILTGFTSIFNGQVVKKKNLIKYFNELNIHVIATSNWQKSQLILNGLNDNLISIQRQSLHLTNILPLSKPINKNKGKFRIGFLGRLSHEKGTKLLIDILKTFLETSNIEFNLAFTSNYSKQIWNEIIELQKMRKDYIEINLDLIDSQKDLFFSSIDLLFIPSFCLETGPFVLLEALFHSKNILCPNVGGPLEFAKEFPNHIYLYQWNNRKDIFKQIQRLSTRFEQVDFNYGDLFLEKQNQFINKHKELYSKVIEINRV